MSITAVATMTSKGQLTIPKAVREALGLYEGAGSALRLTQSRAQPPWNPSSSRCPTSGPSLCPGLPP